MKFVKILLLGLIFNTQMFAQINGNKNLTTITKPLSGLRTIDVQFNANITLDYNLKEEITITADENIMEYIGMNFTDGKLTLDQIKWIDPSQLPIIVVGTPFLQSIYQGTHSSTILKNVDANSLNIEGNVGKVKAAGRTTELRVVTTGTDVDLSELQVTNAFISIDDDSKVIIDKVTNLKTDLDDKARLVLLSEIDNYSEPVSKKKTYSAVNPDLKWIDFKIKNNSLKRNHFVVIGPKKDGSTFSYGFSLFPGASKNEKWSVGTKIYKEKRSGALGTLLVTIDPSNEGEVVDLFR